MSKVLRVWLAIVFLVGLFVLVNDTIFMGNNITNGVTSDELGNMRMYLIADGVFCLSAFLLLIGKKMGSLGVWLAIALNLYMIFYKVYADLSPIDAVQHCAERFDHQGFISSASMGGWSILTFFLMLLIPLITTIWVTHKNSEFR